jgi:hypothetical protein
MPHKQSNPATLGASAGLGKSFLLGGWNDPEDSLAPLELQAKTLVRRFGLAPDRAQLLAMLAFLNGRATWA